ncbi:MAG: electron transport complex subunit E [Clostridia bacterium]|nr:electron transport complex subunit E [Clostridia bacterium]
MAEKKSLFKEFSKGIVIENPVLRLVLGTCPTLATTTSVESAVGMGLAASIVLICSNVVISALRKVIPSKVRIPAYIVVIASFVTIVQMLVKAFTPDLDKQLGVYLPLIVVNCIILGRAEAFAGKNPVLASAVDGLGMGVGFTAALFLMSTVREVLGAGSFYGAEIPGLSAHPMLVFILPPGGFFVFGILMATVNRIAESRGKPRAELRGCEACPMATVCKLHNDGRTEPLTAPASEPLHKAKADTAAKRRAAVGAEAPTEAKPEPVTEAVTEPVNKEVRPS